MTSKRDSPQPPDFNDLTIAGLDSQEDQGPPSNEADRVLEDSPRVGYQDKFVAFVDLLGFRQIVMRSSKHHEVSDETNFKKETVEGIHSALAGIPHYDYAEYFRPKYLGERWDIPRLSLGVAGFSDTLVFWSDETPEAFGLLIYAVFRTVREFTLRGFYCRGGIKLGELLIDASGFDEGARTTPVLFGPAFVGAYDLEHRNANEARIILCNASTRRLLQYKSDATSPTLVRFFNEFLFQAKDGPWQIDVFSDFHHPTLDEKDSLLSQATMISAKLRSVLDEYTESPTVFRKLTSVANALNTALEAGGAMLPELLKHKVALPAPR